MKHVIILMIDVPPSRAKTSNTSKSGYDRGVVAKMAIEANPRPEVSIVVGAWVGRALSRQGVSLALSLT